MSAGNRSSRWVPAVIVGGGVAVLSLGALLLHRATAATNDVALASQPKGVTVLRAKEALFRSPRRYVGTIEPWVTASVGPQLVSAYVETVLVRPGSPVKRGQVLATLDCRNTSALSKQIRMQARALEATQAALTREAARIGSLLDGGFVSPNEVEQKAAESAAKEAQLLGLQAQLLGSDLQVADCILRAPFDGEIGDRFVDPGAYARPGAALVTVVDRGSLRVTADVPESDFEAVAPHTVAHLEVLATGQRLAAQISRRAPSADPGTRTIHFEIDLANHDRSIPAGTTADIHLDAGKPIPALQLPLSAAAVRGDKASLVVVEGTVAHRVAVPLVGEREGEIFVQSGAGLAPGALVVVEGRAGLAEGDEVAAQELARAATETGATVAPDGQAALGGQTR